MATLEEVVNEALEGDEVAGLVRYPESADEPVRERDAELVARVEARVASFERRELGEEALVVVEDQALGQKFGEMMADPLERVRPVYLPRELCEERSVIEAFLRGGLTEREQYLAELWLDWDNVATGRPSTGGMAYAAVTAEQAEGLRTRVYLDLAASYSQAVGEPGSKVRSGADAGPRVGGLVLSKESVRETEEEEGAERGPSLERRVVAAQRWLEELRAEGGEVGPANGLAWLDGYVQGLGDDIEETAERLGALEETLRGQWLRLQRHKAVVEGRRIVVGALLLAIEERGG